MADSKRRREKISLGSYLHARRIEFYQNFNYEYFYRKLLMLLIHLQNEDGLKEKLMKIEYQSLKIEALPDAEEETKDYKRDLELEIHMTLFHAIETLFRFFFMVTLEGDQEHVKLKQYDSHKFREHIEAFSKREFEKIYPPETKIEDMYKLAFYPAIDFSKNFTKEKEIEIFKRVDGYMMDFASRFMAREIYNDYKHCSLDYKLTTFNKGGIKINNFSLMDHYNNAIMSFKYPKKMEKQFSIKKVLTFMQPDQSATKIIVITWLLQNIVENRKFALKLISMEEFQKTIRFLEHDVDSLYKKGINLTTLGFEDQFSSD